MAGGPSPSSTSPSNLTSNRLPRSSLSSSSSPPQKHTFTSSNAMTSDVFTPGAFSSMPTPIGERRHERNGVMSLMSLNSDPNPNLDPASLPSLLLRKLPSTSDRDSVGNMLLFAKDLVSYELLGPTYAEDQGFVSAIARFQNLESAQEARDLLNGKMNTTGDAKLIVDLLQDGLPASIIGSRRNTVDSASVRQGSVSTASTIAGPTANGRQSSRYNGTFQQNMEKMSPPNNNGTTPSLGGSDFPVQNIFSPTSPVSNTFNIGKNFINSEADDDDGLLKESIGVATQNGTPVQSLSRRTTNPSNTLSRFANLSLNTNGVNGMSPPPVPTYASPRSGANALQSPSNSLSSAMSPQQFPSAMNGQPPNVGYQGYSHQYAPRSQYPPVNPADQNPPCNTLYVGNLPVDTSEDELKQVFSKERGYKRLCFRTKQNGPMCFVEFDDITCATRTLNNLYGVMLSNSTKGGIRLSFSKNPLGVRSGQQTNVGACTTVAPSAPLSGYSGSVPPGFSLPPMGPPPGLSAPPGLPTPGYANGSSGFPTYPNGGFGLGSSDIGANRPPPGSSTNGSTNGFAPPNGNYHYGTGR